MVRIITALHRTVLENMTIGVICVNYKAGVVEEDTMRIRRVHSGAKENNDSMHPRTYVVVNHSLPTFPSSVLHRAADQ